MLSFLKRRREWPTTTPAAAAPTTARTPVTSPAGPVVLSFDVEEHDCIEAAVGLTVPERLRQQCRQRADYATRSLLELLAQHAARATFFLLGRLARDNPALVRAIAAAGHEVASHGWGHDNLHRLSPAEFRADLRASLDTLQQVCGQPVLGYRAPTFSVTTRTAWAVEALAEAGLRYDSSVYPVRHDRYGVPQAPRGPFLLQGPGGARLLELPPATLRVCGLTAAMGGGGYFRLFPLRLTLQAVRQCLALPGPRACMLYFHPWEFDLLQPRLPLPRLRRWRTYVGSSRTTPRLAELLRRFRFERAVDVAERIRVEELPVLSLGEEGYSEAVPQDGMPHPQVVPDSAG